MNKNCPKSRPLPLILGTCVALATCAVLANTPVPPQSDNPGPMAMPSQPIAVVPSERFTPADEQGRYVYLIEFDEPGLLDLHRQARGARVRFDSRAAEIRSESERMATRHAFELSGMSSMLRRELTASHFFQVTHSGMAVRLTESEASRLATRRGIRSIQREREYVLDTFRGPDFIGADAIWSGAAVPGGAGLRGAGMVVGVLDSAVHIHAPAFTDDPACGHGVSAPPKVLSHLNCATTDEQGLCNGPAIAPDTHGTHVAGTVLGNDLDQTADPLLNLPVGFTSISGVAPCASLRAYAVCPESCPGAQIQAGMNSIILHGDVDVMSFSISGGTSPWSDNDRRKLDLVGAGVFVSASAGNTGSSTPDPVGQVNHRGPWVTSVAASTHDIAPNGEARTGDVLAGFSLRGPTPALLQNLQKPDITAPGVQIYASVVDFRFSVSGPSPVPEALTNARMRIGSASPSGSALTDHPVRFDPSQDPDAEGCSVGGGFAPGFFNGAVALIRRGTCTFAEKINNAAEAGAEMVLIWNNVFGPFGMETPGQNPDVPAFSISQAVGEELRGFISSNPTATINYAGDAGQYGFLSGTSMSSPHVVGAGLLVRQAHPDWTPVEVGSALRMTAVKEGLKPNGETPWDPDDVGSGRVDLTRAARAGLVMHEFFDNFLAADPSAGGDVRTLNLPALRNLDCSPSCSWTRTVRNTINGSSSWTAAGVTFSGDYQVEVSPAAFSFNGGLEEAQTMTVTVSPNGNQSGALSFGEIVFVEQNGKSPDLHWTLAVKGRENPAPIAALSEFVIELAMPEPTASTSVILSNLAEAGADPLNFNITSAQPRTISLGGQIQLADGPAEPVALIVDQGIETLTGGGGVQQKLWVNQFTPAPLDLPFVLEQVQVGWAPANGNVEAGDRYDVYVWRAPDRDPLGPVELLASVTGLTVTSGINFKVVDLPEPVSIDAASGDVLIGVVSRERRENYRPIIGDSGPSLQRSWLGVNFEDGIVPDPPVFSEAGTFGLTEMDRNWTVRGSGTGGSACLDPGEVSWLSVSPDQGSIAPGDQLELAIEINMTGQAPGPYLGRLCITTDDPDQPVLVVSLQVDFATPIFSDRFELR